jgi:hypothetical protein
MVYVKAAENNLVNTQAVVGKFPNINADHRAASGGEFLRELWIFQPKIFNQKFEAREKTKTNVAGYTKFKAEALPG